MNWKTGIYLLTGCFLGTQFCTAQGPITPDAAPAPMMKTLQEMEPRGMIKSVPVTITQQGSYYFVTNLTCISSSDAIKVTVPNVTIDMRGFTLFGNGDSSGNGIYSASPNLKVFNGNILGFSGTDPALGGAAMGICAAGNAAIVRDVKLEANGIGLAGGSHALIECVSVIANSKGNGIYCKDNSVVNRCRAESNYDNGIAAGQGTTLTQCTAINNGINGILISAPVEQSQSSAVIDKCTANFNIANGIMAESGANIMNCSVDGNGFFEAFNGNHGIYVTASLITQLNSGGSIIRNCTANNNLGDGIHVLDDTQIIENSCNGNGLAPPFFGSWAGITAEGDNNRIYGNVTSSNSGIGDPQGWPVVGIQVTGIRNRIEANQSSFNISGAYLVTSTNNLVIKNSAYGTPQASDYSIVAGNHVGSIVSPAACGLIPPNANSGLGIAAGVTDTAWANFDD